MSSMEWVEGSEIARGATATVTRGAEGVAVKTFDLRVPLIAAQIEEAGLRAAHSAGIPSPRLHEFDEGPPTRLIMDFVEGSSLGELVPVLGPEFVGEELARCQDLVRQAQVPQGIGVLNVATLLGYFLDAGPLPSILKQDFKQELESLPTGTTFCHLDLHPLNVVWDGERSVIIDWMNARLGPAAVDVARTRVILDALPHLVGDAPQMLEAIVRLTDSYLRATYRIAPRALEESEPWMRVVRAARLAEETSAGERAALLAALGYDAD